MHAEPALSTWRTPAELTDWLAARLQETPLQLARTVWVMAESAPLLVELRGAIAQSNPRLLYGVHFGHPLHFATVILGRQAPPLPSTTWTALAIERLLSSDRLRRRLKSFDGRLLCRPGYTQALAQTITELESARLSVGDLQQSATQCAATDRARLEDIAIVWRELQLAEDAPVSAPAHLARATHAWRHGIRPASPPSTTLVICTTAPDRSLTEFAEALPNTQRIDPQPVHAVDQVLHCPAMTVEDAASVDDEIEQTISWVVEQLLAGVQPESILIVAPDAEAYAPLLDDALTRLAMNRPVKLRRLGPQPLGDRLAGRRLGQLTSCLASGLSAAAITDLALTWGVTWPNGTPLSRSAILQVLAATGIVGGSEQPSQEWIERLRHLIHQPPDPPPATLFAEPIQLDLFETPNAAPVTADRVADTAKQLLDWLTPICQTYDRIQRGAAPADIHADCMTLVNSADDGVDRTLRTAAHHPLVADRRGPDALAVYRRLAKACTLTAPTPPGNRFVTLATPRQALGHPAAAMRIVGLAEGLAPRAALDDPIVPDRLRRQLAAHHEKNVRLRVERTTQDLHVLLAIAGAPTVTLSLSAPRRWVDGSNRELSLAYIHLARHSVDAAGLRQQVGAGRRQRQAQVEAFGIAPRARLFKVASAAGAAAPPEWLEPGSFNVNAVSTHTTDSWNPNAWQAAGARGLSADRPVSPTRLRDLFWCPFRYFLRNELALEPPPEVEPIDRLHPFTYGRLVHRILEDLLSGEAVQLGPDSTDLTAAAQTLAADAFQRACDTSAMRSPGVIERERRHLLTDIHRLVSHEQALSPRTVAYTELPFGFESPAALGDAALYVRGQIDRVDRLPGGRLALRDYKTGRLKSLDDTPIDPLIDLQLAVYCLAIETLTDGAGGAVGEAAYVHPTGARDAERAFTEETLQHLYEAAGGWLTLGRTLIEHGAFPRTPDEKNCTFCAWRAFCGDQAAQRARQALSQAAPDTPEAAYWALRSGVES